MSLAVWGPIIPMLKLNEININIALENTSASSHRVFGVVAMQAEKIIVGVAITKTWLKMHMLRLNERMKKLIHSELSATVECL